MGTVTNGTVTACIDGHAHLDAMPDYQAAVAEARAAGILGIVAVGMDLTSNEKILQIAAENDDIVFPALGYHPWSIRAADVEVTLAFLEEHLDGAVAIGEVGLDFRSGPDRDVQEAVFTAVLAMARRYDKPLILHGLHAYERLFAEVCRAGVAKAVFHWYADSPALLAEILAAGHFISATPALAYSEPHRAAIRQAPLERILLETDCPVAYRGVLSRPRDVLITLQEVARIKGLEAAEVARTTVATTFGLFGMRRENVKKEDA